MAQLLLNLPGPEAQAVWEPKEAPHDTAQGGSLTSLITTLINGITLVKKKKKIIKGLRRQHNVYAKDSYAEVQFPVPPYTKVEQCFGLSFYISPSLK